MLYGRGVAGQTKEESAMHHPHPAATHRQIESTCLCVALRTTAKEVFFMKKIKSLLVDSFRELKDIKTLAMSAMLLAIAVVLGFNTLQLTESLKIGFAYLPNELAGMMFGPVVGAIIGGTADVLKFLVNPTGPFFPGFTISGICGGFIYGCVLYKKPLHIGRIILANSLVTVLVNLLLNTYWISVLYGNAFVALLPARIIKQLIMLPIEIVLFYTVARVLSKAKVFAMLKTPVTR